MNEETEVITNAEMDKDDFPAADSERGVKNRKFSLYNGFWQVFFVGCIALCCPGIFNAVNGLGNAGQASSETAAAFANALLYFFFAIFGYFGGLVYSILGARMLFVSGGSTYVLYMVMTYLSSQPSTISWAQYIFPMSGAILGIGAAFFWTAQGALMLAYAPEESKGFYISMFWVIFNLGGVIGGIITFAVNFNNTTDKAGQANPPTYFVFVALTAIGSLLGLIIMSPKHVTLENGKKATLQERAVTCKDVSISFLESLMAITNRNMSFLFVLFFSSNFFYTYVFNEVNGALFTIRTRGLNSALIWGSQMFGSVIFSFVVDERQKKPTSLRRRGLSGFIFVAVVMSLSWILGIVVHYKYPIADKIDLAESRYAFPCITMIGYGIADSVIQTFSYWIMGILSGRNVNMAARFSGYYKGVQSFGAAIAWLLDTKYVNASRDIQLWLCVALFVVGMMLTLPVVLGLESKKDVKKFETTSDMMQDKVSSVS